MSDFDEGIRAGQVITPYYDPLLGKLAVRGNDRHSAISTMIRALDEFQINGIDTTIPFCLEFIRHPSFKYGKYCTHTLDEVFDEIIEKMTLSDRDKQIAGSITAVLNQTKATLKIEGVPESSSQWLKSGRQENLR